MVIVRKVLKTLCANRHFVYFNLNNSKQRADVYRTTFWAAPVDIFFTEMLPELDAVYCGFRVSIIHVYPSFSIILYGCMCLCK